MQATNKQTSKRISALRPSRVVLAACNILTASLMVVSVREAGAQVLNNTTSVSIQQQQQQQQQQQANALQNQLNQIQQQAQRQLNQLNGMVLNAVSNSSTRYSNVLEAISSVGKVIHQQISAATNPNHVNIVANGPNLQQSAGSIESANNKKNEYQAIQMGTEMGPSFSSFGPSNSTQLFGSNNANYREQGEFLRQEIGRRAGQLQQVVASSMDLLKNNGDMIMRRLLEQMNVRLDQAKAKADKIILNDPVAMNEVTVKALATINSGLNNLNNIISNIVTRMDLANKQDQQQQQQQQRLNQQAGLSAAGVGQTLQQRLQQAAADPALPPLLDTSRFKANLHQLSQQFQQALNGSTLHQQLALIRNQRLQQQALTSMGANQAKASPSLAGSGPTTLNYQQAQ